MGNSALDDQYMGVLDDSSFRSDKYLPFCEYGVGKTRANEIWDAVKGMSNGDTCGRFLEALSAPIDVDRDHEGGAIDKP